MKRKGIRGQHAKNTRTGREDIQLVRKGRSILEKLQCGIKTVVLEGRGIYKALSKSFLLCRRRHRQCRDASLTMTMTAVVAYPIGGSFGMTKHVFFL